MKYVTVKAVIHSLTDLIDEGTIHLNDTIIFAKLTQNLFGDRSPQYPAGTLNLVIRSADPEADEDTDVYIYTKEMKEEN